VSKAARFVVAMTGAGAVGLAGFAGWSLYPHADPRPLRAPLVAATSAQGQELLAGAEASADYERLSRSFQAQSLASYCGVASSVIVLRALGRKTTQADFFANDSRGFRARLEVTFGGMSLGELAALLRAHDVRTSIHYADESSVDRFRDTVATNLGNDADYLIVNYWRAPMGQGEMGHMSPVAAYDRDTDSVLIMDTASNKYSPAWVPLELLFEAMRTVDSASGRMRGYVEVAR
jgi:hypothetical protein